MYLHWQLQNTSGVLVCNPVPENASLDASSVEHWIEKSLQEAHNRGIRGKALTPFLLSAPKTLSGGQTLVANRALALSNARLASQLAVALQERWSGA